MFIFLIKYEKYIFIPFFPSHVQLGSMEKPYIYVCIFIFFTCSYLLSLEKSYKFAHGELKLKQHVFLLKSSLKVRNNYGNAMIYPMLAMGHAELASGLG
jgi:hypothetical protein